ncbi:Spy/CpxP family protein refolding chaperone [Algoriphagus iocasae]|uniref:Spy/CpxP family protein refolding chaperone n=1 Tax=Algoriphagus iocasae TaxID=1836499 RepID=A0A841MUC2_9BACT|nr:hypothetical protein [Algoriphagus iocasae]MBB6327696.1 Spy/CpxP family protein refolding chaperone [Algoriphagus iocasae]
MKKWILFLSLSIAFISIKANAQTMSVDDEITLIQAEFGKDKKMLVDAYMDLPESVAQGFWTVYQEYEDARKELSRERMKIINDYLNEFESIGEAEADDLAKRTIKNDQKLANLHARYYKKFKKVSSALDAAKFLQVDTYIHNTIRNLMQQELPFIGEEI